MNTDPNTRNGKHYDRALDPESMISTNTYAGEHLASESDLQRSPIPIPATSI